MGSSLVMSGLDTLELIDRIEIAIVAADLPNAVRGRDRRMQCIACGELIVLVKQRPRRIENVRADGENRRHDAAREIVNALAVAPAPQSAIAMQDLLQNFRIDDRFDLIPRNSLEILNTRTFVPVLRSGGVHENVGVDQDHVGYFTGGANAGSPDETA
jgi:hypothetical protein